MKRYKEKEIQEYLASSLESHYDESEVKKERAQDGYRIDVAIPNELIAIEVKGEKNAIKKGVGQCIRYEVGGWSSYLCISKHYVNDTVKNMCLQAGVGLISATDMDGYRCTFDVIIQNDIKLKGSGRGQVRTSGSVKPYKLLDVLEITDMKDLHELEDNLVNRRMVVVDDMKYRDGRQIRTDHSILPET